MKKFADNVYPFDVTAFLTDINGDILSASFSE